MTIRKATSKEVEIIIRHSVKVLQESTLGFVKLNEEKALQMVGPALSNDGYYLVYVDKDEICGWIGVGKSYDFLTDEIVGVIPEIYVYPKYRQQKIAEKLCSEALHQLSINGFKKVQANVFSGNIVKHLCNKFGFREVYTLIEKKL